MVDTVETDHFLAQATRDYTALPQPCHREKSPAALPIGILVMFGTKEHWRIPNRVGVI
jgi:hypothetical protein